MCMAIFWINVHHHTSADQVSWEPPADEGQWPVTTFAVEQRELGADPGASAEEEEEAGPWGLAQDVRFLCASLASRTTALYS